MESRKKKKEASKLAVLFLSMYELACILISHCGDSWTASSCVLIRLSNLMGCLKSACQSLSYIPLCMWEEDLVSACAWEEDWVWVCAWEEGWVWVCTKRVFHILCFSTSVCLPPDLLHSSSASSLIMVAVFLTPLPHHPSSWLLSSNPPLPHHHFPWLLSSLLLSLSKLYHYSFLFLFCPSLPDSTQCLY